MRDSNRDGGAGALDTAGKRLERALGLLETRVHRRLKRMEQLDAQRGGADGGERAQLLAELQAARARERALEAIAAEASAALGRAADEVRAALAEDVRAPHAAMGGQEGAPAAPPESEPGEAVPLAAPDDASVPDDDALEAVAATPLAAQG